MAQGDALRRSQGRDAQADAVWAAAEARYADNGAKDALAAFVTDVTRRATRVTRLIENRMAHTEDCLAAAYRDGNLDDSSAVLLNTTIETLQQVKRDLQENGLWVA